MCVFVWMYVCVLGVAVVSPGCRGPFVPALSYVELRLCARAFVLSPLLSVLSRGPAPPRPICRVRLIADHNAVTL